jgi:hypothetical protein
MGRVGMSKKRENGYAKVGVGIDTALSIVNEEMKGNSGDKDGNNPRQDRNFL